MMKILDETTEPITTPSTINKDTTHTDNKNTIIPNLEHMSSKPSEVTDINLKKSTSSVEAPKPVTEAPKPPNGIIGTDVKLSTLTNPLHNVEKELKAQIGGKTPKTIEIKPTFCSVNKNKDGTQMSLHDEPGIPELKKLYYDVFDYNTAKFTSMSKKSEEEYRKDLATFYQSFTGKSKMPSSIKSFSDIKLRDFSLHNNCKKNGLFTKTFHGSFKNKLFSKYAAQLKTMTENANKNREKLIGILDKLFRYIKDPETKTTKMITLHPKLTEKSLQKIVVETRKLIVQLYVSCDKEYLEIIETFEAIIETQVKKITEQKIKNLQTQQESLLTDLA